MSGPPTTFFMATEEQVMGTSTFEGRLNLSEPRRTNDGDARQAPAARDKTPEYHPGQRRPSVSGGRRGSIKKPVDCIYGVQSLEDALGEALEEKSKEKKDEQQPESSNGGLASLLGLNRRKTVTSTDGNEKTAISENPGDRSQESSRPPLLRDTHPHDHHKRQSSCVPTTSQPLTPLQIESPTPNSAVPSTPKSGSFRSLRLSDEDEGTEDGASQAIASSEEEDDDRQNNGETDISESVMPELVMPSLSMPARRPFTARGKQMGRLKVCVAGPVGKRGLLSSTR